MQTDLLAPQIASLDLTLFMREALYEAEQAGLAGELPIGAVVVIDGRIVSRGRAQHQAKKPHPPANRARALALHPQAGNNQS